MKRDIEGIPFHHVSEIVPEFCEGVPVELKPQSRYRNRSNLSLHRYGRGPFCKFTVPSRFYGKRGVYVLFVDGKARYVGECEDLGSRFNTGYGNISPRNCFEGGQQTNCRINSLILKASKKASRIHLFFHESEDRFRLERLLITKLHPEWNRSAGKSGLPRRARQGTHAARVRTKVPTSASGKYAPLEEYLKRSEKMVERLSFEEIESILESHLPASASKYGAWWSNGGHTHSNHWMNAGWVVKSTVLGKSVTFEKTRS